jgi:hypothetical protein
MADDLDGVASAFASTGTIEEGSQLDRSIGKLVQALTMLASDQSSRRRVKLNITLQSVFCFQLAL